jgi:hypothetical protein
MTLIRWLPHALENLAEREIDRSEADLTLASPEFAVDDPPGRRILMRRYLDSVLKQEMLLRIVVEETADELVVVTLYKTSQIKRYLKGLAP